MLCFFMLLYFCFPGNAAALNFCEFGILLTIKNDRAALPAVDANESAVLNGVTAEVVATGEDARL